MKSKINRRNFFVRVSQAGVSGCALMFGLKFSSIDSFSKFLDDVMNLAVVKKIYGLVIPNLRKP